MNPNAIRTTEQSIKLNTLVSKLGIDKDTKADLVMQASNNRTKSSKFLTISECARLIGQLAGSTKTPDQQRVVKVLDKTRWRLMYTLRDHGMADAKGQPDKEKINQYTTHYWGKKVEEMQMDELNRYIAVVKKWRLKNASN